MVLFALRGLRWRFLSPSFPTFLSDYGYLIFKKRCSTPGSEQPLLETGVKDTILPFWKEPFRY